MERTFVKEHMTTLDPATLQRLEAVGLDPTRLPRHVAVIMDGNGRWATERGLPRIEGHRRGVKSVRTCIEECCRLGIEQLTLYCLSIENWKRPQEEIDLLMVLLHQYLISERELILRENIRFTVIGRDRPIPMEVLREIADLTQVSARNTGMTLCLAINYGGRAELADAMKKIAVQVKQGELDPDAIDESTIDEALTTAGMPDPDLLIRTAAEMRVSNFLLWQIAYAELWVTPTYWPDFDAKTLHEGLREFARRERRFGGLSDMTEAMG